VWKYAVFRNLRKFNLELVRTLIEIDLGNAASSLTECRSA
jgi:hypothetical protein